MRHPLINSLLHRTSQIRHRMSKSSLVELMTSLRDILCTPTILLTTNPKYTTMETELFGPVVTIYVYEDAKWEETIDLVDNTSVYGLTGAVIAQDRQVIEDASLKLVNAAGNFYINDKPSGAVVGQQPFGGARASDQRQSWLDAKPIAMGIHEID